jgi:hypothetical protein
MSESSTPAGDRRPGAPRLLLLNALFPGLGHLVARHRGWALLLAALALVLLVGGLLVALTSNSVALAARMFDPAVLTALLVLQGLLLVWRLFAVGAVRLVVPFRATGPTVLAGVLAIAIVVGPQLWLAGLTLDARDAATEVFAPVAEGGAWVPTETPPPVESDDPDFAIESPSVSPSITPSPSPTPEIPRINVLLIGMDSGVGRNTALTDTMIVASLDPVGRTVSMASVPRDMVDVPLPDGRKFRGKINSLVSYVRWHPKKFPGAKDGQSVLTAAIGTLLNIKIDYWAQVNLPGFVTRRLGGRVVVNVTDGLRSALRRVRRRRLRVSPGRYRWTARPLPTPACARPPARATSPAPPVSRRSSPPSATRSSRAPSWTTRAGSSSRWARRSAPTSSPA